MAETPIERSAPDSRRGIVLAFAALLGLAFLFVSVYIVIVIELVVLVASIFWLRRGPFRLAIAVCSSIFLVLAVAFLFASISWAATGAP